jgi:hypothetical protein
MRSNFFGKKEKGKHMEMNHLRNIESTGKTAWRQDSGKL